jgi:D-tagatose-1,6-bisphosphate aldolase subunit GatZ/KbaZ
MQLDEIVHAQKRGEPRGIASICSAHPWVLKAAMSRTRKDSEAFRVLLVESTCNQVNQFGGYTGMRPVDFVDYVRGIAAQNGFPPDRIMLGGDHLGPSVWQDEPVETAMEKALTLVKDYVEAGFTKLHIDCSMPVGNDPEGALAVGVSAHRAAQLVEMAECSTEHTQRLRYVIGTEVPIPGGAQIHENTVSVTTVPRAQETIEVTHEAFLRQGLGSAWERVVALVVQPGVEFGDDFVLPYEPDAAQALSSFIEPGPMVYEAHSTDYQTPEALWNLVRDHFAILKVGPALTFAFREAVFALAMMENELFPSKERSHIISIIEQVMLRHPEHWRRYYHGDLAEQAFKRKYSLSDRMRYYWTRPLVQQALDGLLARLAQLPMPVALLKQFVPDVYAGLEDSGETITPEKILLAKIKGVLVGYEQACNPD